MSINNKLNDKNKNFISIINDIDDIFLNNSKNVILFFLDNLSCNILRQSASYKNFLKSHDAINVRAITSQFPSTTTAHVSGACLGKSLIKTGLYEWYIYEPKLDDVICPIKNSFLGDSERETLAEYIKLEDLLPKNTFYSNLKKKGVESFSFYEKELINTSFTKMMSKDSTLIGYNILLDIINPITTFSKKYNKTYSFVYYDKIDKASHSFGPNSNEVISEIEQLSNILNSIVNGLKANNEKFEIILTADHGQTKINKKYYLDNIINEDSLDFKIGRHTNKKLISGSPRAMFLHLKSLKGITEFKKVIREETQDNIKVYEVAELIEADVFGIPSKHFKARIGEILLLPEPNTSIWMKSLKEIKEIGLHGGATKEETEIPYYKITI